MKFEWDESKNEANIQKHGFDFADAHKVFTGPLPLFVRLDTREDHGEERWRGIGMLDGMVVVVVVYTEPSTNVIRLISMRKALKRERKEYESRIKN